MTWEDGEPTLGLLFSPKLVDMFGAARVPRTEITQQHMDVAASLQAMLEEAEFAIVRKLQQETGQRALCMAGGVALNSAFNGKILPETDFRIFTSIRRRATRERRSACAIISTIKCWGSRARSS